MQHDRDLVSVIIPVYNGEAFLAEAVESVMNQGYEPIEIIVVDDGSTDRTAEVAAAMGRAIRYAYQENRGPAAARNRGLQMSAAGIIGFLDADDLWVPRKMEIQMRLLSGNVAAEVVVGRQQFMNLESVCSGGHVFQMTDYVRPALSLGCSLFRKSAFEKVGLFDESQFHCDDWDWFMRAREQSVTILLHKDVMLYVRRHERNITNQVETGNRFAIRMIKKSLDRRRQHRGQVESLPDLHAIEGDHLQEGDGGNESR